MCVDERKKTSNGNFLNCNSWCFILHYFSYLTYISNGNF